MGILSTINDVTVIGFLFLIVGIIGVLFDFMCGIVLILGIVMIAVGTTYNPLKKKEDKSERFCPNCGRAIPFDSNSCPYCGKVFTNFISLSGTKKKENAIDESELVSGRMGAKSCPSCGYENESESKFCKKCGTVL